MDYGGSFSVASNFTMSAAFAPKLFRRGQQLSPMPISSEKDAIGKIGR
jgi:hypothetical protein